MEFEEHEESRKNSMRKIVLYFTTVVEYLLKKVSFYNIWSFYNFNLCPYFDAFHPDFTQFYPYFYLFYPDLFAQFLPFLPGKFNIFGDL